MRKLFALNRRPWSLENWISLFDNDLLSLLKSIQHLLKRGNFPCHQNDTQDAALYSYLLAVDRSADTMINSVSLTVRNHRHYNGLCHRLVRCTANEKDSVLETDGPICQTALIFPDFQRYSCRFVEPTYSAPWVYARTLNSPCDSLSLPNQREYMRSSSYFPLSRKESPREPTASTDADELRKQHKNRLFCFTWLRLIQGFCPESRRRFLRGLLHALHVL